MFNTRTFVAVVVGGVVLFAWGAIDHMALPTGEMGIQSLPAEATLLPQMKQGISERGFYFFPGMDVHDKSEAAQKAWQEKYRAGPRGVLIYDPTGGEAMSPAQLGTEFVSDLLAALFLTIVLAQVRGGTAARAGLGLLAGLFGWMAIDVSYWNWYRFPSAIVVSSLIEQGVGGLLAGLAIGIVLGRSKSQAATA